MKLRPIDIRSCRAVPSALLAVALLSGAGPGPRFDQSLQVAGIRQSLAQRPAHEPERRLKNLLSNATRITFHPWSSGSTLSIAPEPTLHGRARVGWGGSIRLAIRF